MENKFEELQGKKVRELSIQKLSKTRVKEIIDNGIYVLDYFSVSKDSEKNFIYCKNHSFFYYDFCKLCQLYNNKEKNKEIIKNEEIIGSIYYNQSRKKSVFKIDEKDRKELLKKMNLLQRKNNEKICDNFFYEGINDRFCFICKRVCLFYRAKEKIISESYASNFLNIYKGEETADEPSFILIIYILYWKASEIPENHQLIKSFLPIHKKCLNFFIESIKYYENFNKEILKEEEKFEGYEEFKEDF